MNRRNFVVLALAAFVLVVLAVVLAQRDKGGGDVAAARVGQDLVRSFAADAVVQIRIRKDSESVSLSRKGDLWQVDEKGYPADADRIRDLLLTLRSLKVLQADPIGADQRARVDLGEPGSKGGGTGIDFLDGTGKVLLGLIAGKTVAKKAAADDPGVPSGRFLLVKGDENVAVTVGNALSEVDPKIQPWLAKAFFRAEVVRAVSVEGGDGALRWGILRDGADAPWKFADGKGPGPDEGKANEVARALDGLAFSDVKPAAAAAETGVDKGPVVSISTVDGFDYRVRIGSESGDFRWIAVATEAKLESTRSPATGEKAEDKEKLDKAFAERRKSLEEKLARERALGAWIHSVPKSAVAAVLVPREKLLPEKKPAPEADKAPGKGVRK